MSKKNTNNRKTPKNNVIDNYFAKTSQAIYLQRLQEEIEECELSNAGSDNVKKNEGTKENDSDELLALKQTINSLEEKNKELTEKNTKLINDNRALKKMLDTSKSMNLCKDVKIQRLESQLAVGATNINNKTDTCKQTISEESPKMNLFDGFEQCFTAAEMLELSSIGKGKRLDGAFITKCLKFLYKEDVSKLKTKCVGDQHKMRGKSIITLTKKNVMAVLLNRRVKSEGVNDKIEIERCDRLTRLTGDAIYKITKRDEGKVVKISKIPSVTANETPNDLMLQQPSILVPNVLIHDPPQSISNVLIPQNFQYVVPFNYF